MLPRSLLLPVGGFAVVLAAFVAIAISAGLPVSLGAHFAAAVVAFALIFLPYWAFGFRAAGPLRRCLNRPALRLAASTLFIAPYPVFAIPLHVFEPDILLALLAAALVLTAILDRRGSDMAHNLVTPPAPDWRDLLALVILAACVEAPFFRRAFPVGGLSGLSKLIFVNLGLYGFLVVRPVGGIGFDLHFRFTDIRVGLREFFFFLPIALTLGFVLNFLHFHPVGWAPGRFAGAWLFTLFFVALPEEIFFRGLLLNLLARRWSAQPGGTRRALIVTSLIFGLAHFPKRAAFNWRYVILAAIAGIFYGRAYLDRRRVLASGVTHATVDAVWSVWLR